MGLNTKNMLFANDNINLTSLSTDCNDVSIIIMHDVQSSVLFLMLLNSYEIDLSLPH